MYLRCKKLRLGHNLLISLNDRVNRVFPRILFSRNFAYVKFCDNKTLAKISKFTVYKVPKSDVVAKVYCKAGLIFAVMIWLKIKTGKYEVFRFLHS